MRTLTKSTILLALTISLGSFTARADEGMWMIHAINQALEANMQAKGLRLQADEIYNADAEGASLADAVVSLDFGCSGSIISDNGLVITNHHCAYGDVHSLSTSEHNYLEDGFWAMKSTDEKPIPGKHIFFLKRVLDITEEAEEMIEREGLAGNPMGPRRLAHLLETKYSRETGLEASLATMWAGSKYYMALYEEYSDIRLVAAPPVSIAAFGGDIDNWEWPQHKCDFALYRIYTGPDGKPATYSPENIPLKPSRKLTISLAGYQPGDFTMVIGYPGRTDRYASSAKVNYEETLSYPLSNFIRGDQMEIINGWMNVDPEIRLKYSDTYFSLSNVQENNEGMVQCFTRFKVADERRALERELQEWIDSDPARSAKWGGLLAKLDSTYEAVSHTEANLICYRETLIRGTKLALISTRMHSSLSRLDNAKVRETLIRQTATEYEALDLRVEKDLFLDAARTFYANVDSVYWGPFQKELYAAYKDDLDAFSEAVWDASWMTDEKQITRFLTTSSASEMEPFFDDPLYRFFQDLKITVFNDELNRIQGANTMANLNGEYSRALYQMRLDKGVPQYPNANSTMRIAYGTVGGFEPRDGIWCSWYSSPKGILEKYDPGNYDFNLKPDWKSLLDARCADPDPSFAFNADFLTDNDITGGNSGSPVLNADGELIGLAFDGNKESLASDVSYTEGYNKCVNVDIRFVIWTLRHYAHLDWILEEIGL